MMRMRKLRLFVAGIGMMLLIFDSKCALEGAKTGLDLCIRTVIPSLFPFFVLSMLLTSSMGNHNYAIVRKLSRIIHIPHSAGSVLIPAFLGGYPVGAKCAADLYHKGILEKQEAERLLSFCSNAGPSFLFGMVSAFFPRRQTIWLLWAIHISGAIFTALLFPDQPTETGKYCTQTDPEENTDIMLSALKAIAVVCGWVVIFRTLIAFLDRWVLWVFPQWLQVFIMGVLELSNGCCQLLQIQNVDLRFVLCSCMISFGGICVLLQTASVTRGLSLRNYLIGKSVQTIFSLLVSCAVITGSGLLYVIGSLLILAIFRKVKNKSGNLKAFPV